LIFNLRVPTAVTSICKFGYEIHFTEIYMEVKNFT